MRYQGIMFRSNEEDSIMFCIPFNMGDRSYSTPIGIIRGWDVDMTESQIVVAEFMLFDGTMVISLEEYMEKMEDDTDDDLNLYVRAVNVAVQECGENVFDMYQEDMDQFKYACGQKVLQAKKQGMFDQRKIIPQWKKVGYDREFIGDVVQLVY